VDRPRDRSAKGGDELRQGRREVVGIGDPLDRRVSPDSQR
jgi:hypothetical protein